MWNQQGTSNKRKLCRGLNREGRLTGQGGANIFLHCLLLSFPLLLPGVWKLGLRRSLNQFPYPSYLNLSLPSARSPLGVGPPTSLINRNTSTEVVYVCPAAEKSWRKGSFLIPPQHLVCILSPLLHPFPRVQMRMVPERLFHCNV